MTESTNVKKKNSKKGVIAVIALIAVITLAVGIWGISAYLTDRQSATNTFTVGRVSIELLEPSWVANNASELTANQELPKDPQIKNTGSNPAYVYLKVTIPKEIIRRNSRAKEELFTVSYNGTTGINTADWNLLNETVGEDSVVRVYYYQTNNGILNASATTNPLFDKIKLANITDGANLEGQSFNVQVDAYAIQSNNLDMPASANTTKLQAQYAWEKYWAQDEDVNSATVTFYDEDGETVLGTSKVRLGTNASYSGETPSKASTQQYSYTFSGWDDPSKLNNVTENRSVRAVYTSTTNKYVVTFYDENGTTKLGESEVEYGGQASFTGSTPTKEADASYTYEFAGWYTSQEANATVDNLSNVVANRSVYAKYTATEKASGTTAANLSTTEYGKYVNLGTNLLGQGQDKDWRIFYKDSQGGIYLILADYLPNSTNIASGVGLTPGTGDYATYGVKSSTNRTDLIDKLNNETAWKTQIFGTNPASKYANVTVKGALDLDTWTKAWNERYGSTDELRISNTVSGTKASGYVIAKNADPTSSNYYVSLGDTTEYTTASNTLFWNNKDTSNGKDGCLGYWLASPSANGAGAVMCVYCGGIVSNLSYNYASYGVRPAVYLPSNILLEEANGVYAIVD